MYTTIWWEGYKAYLQDQDVNANPYRKNSSKWWDWYVGWTEAWSIH